MKTSRPVKARQQGPSSRRRSARSVAGLAVAGLGLSGLAAVSAPAATAATPLPPGPALSLTADTSWWGTNGRVVDIVSSADKAWIAGGFDYVGPTTGRGVVVDASTGAKTPVTNVVDGPVNAAAPDGSGGYYLAGSFSRVGDLRRQAVVHIRADGSVDRSFSPDVTTTTVIKRVTQVVTGTVNAIAVAGDRVILGGEFDAIDGSPVSRLGAVNLDGSLVAGWSAPANKTVNALSLAGGSVYVGGAFTTIGGQSRANLARIQVGSGTVDTAFTARTDKPVLALASQAGATSADDTVWAGGDFTTVTTANGSAARSRLAKVDGTGAVLPWAPSANNQVRAIAVDQASGTAYVGGLFTQVGSEARAQLAGVDASGAVTGFDAALAGCQAPHDLQSTNRFPSCTTEVDALMVSGGTLYAGGVFTTTRGAVRHDAAAYDLATGATTPWLPMPGARVRALSPLGGAVVVGGDFTSVGGQYRRGVAKIDLNTGQLDPSFTADTDDMPVDIELSPDGTRLFLAGTFKSVNGVGRQRVASVDPVTGALDPAFKPKVNDDVYSIAVRQGKVYLGGQFTSVNSILRGHAARISATDGSVDMGWTANTTGPTSAPQKNGIVLSLVVTQDGSKVFLAGPFNKVNGTDLGYGGIVALSGVDGSILPNRLGGVSTENTCGGSNYHWIIRLALSPDDQRLYGGDYCPDYFYQWDAANLGQSKPNGLNWKSWCNGGLQGRLEVNGHFYYGSHGGNKGQGGWCQQSATNTTRITQQRFMVFGTADASLLGYAPEFDTPMGVWSFAAVPQGLLVGGDFTIAGDRNTLQQGLALFRGTP